MSNSKSEFISTDDGIDVFVEHGDFSAETHNFIHGIARETWFGEVDDEDPEYRKKMNPTLRYWRRQCNLSIAPRIILTKRKFQFVPPSSECFGGPEPQYVTRNTDRHERFQYQELVRHPGCKCSRCVDYRYETRPTADFWGKVAGRVRVEV